jgi:hypothetical protein
MYRLVLEFGRLTSDIGNQTLRSAKEFYVAMGRRRVTPGLMSDVRHQTSDFE